MEQNNKEIKQVENKVENKEVQVIGLDVGRGYVKAYSQYKGKTKQCLFKSIIGTGRELNFEEYENPIYINFDSEDYFVGLLAEEESSYPIRNSDDRKNSLTVQVLVAAALNQVAIADEVKIMFGVPYKNFRKTTLNEVIEGYKGKEFNIKDNIENTYKRVRIADVNIFREADAGVYAILKGQKNNTPIALATIGYRTTELTYFNENLKRVDKLSETVELGNQDALSTIKDKLEKENITKETHEIDSSNKYDYMKKPEYKLFSERIQQILSNKWKNMNEVDVYIAGGTALNMEFDNVKFKLVENAQMATAKGLFIVGLNYFN